MTKITPYLSEIKNKPCIKNLHINLLNKCPCKCIMCRKYEWPQKEIDFTILKQFILFFEEQGGETIVFSGGEPLMYSKFKELINFMNTTQIKYSFITTTLGSEENLKLMAENAERIHASYDSNNLKIYEKIRGIDASLKVYNNISFMQKFRKNKIPIRISMVISNINCTEILNMYDVAEELDCKIHYTLVNLWDNLQLTNEQLKDVYSQLVKLDYRVATNIGLIEEIYSFLRNEIKIKPQYCIIQKIHMLIDPDGSVYPCCVLLEENDNYNQNNKAKYGNIYNDSFDAIFEKAKHLQYSPLQKECEGCINRYIHVNKEYSNYVKQDDKLFL